MWAVLLFEIVKVLQVMCMQKAAVLSGHFG